MENFQHINHLVFEKKMEVYNGMECKLNERDNYWIVIQMYI